MKSKIFKKFLDFGRLDKWIFNLWFRHNTEKVIYFLLLDRKLKNPCDEDTEEVLNRSKTGMDSQTLLIVN